MYNSMYHSFVMDVFSSPSLLFCIGKGRNKLKINLNFYKICLAVDSLFYIGCNHYLSYLCDRIFHNQHIVHITELAEILPQSVVARLGSKL